MFRWLAWVAWEWFWISVALATAWHWPWAAPISLLVLGRGQHALAILGHEGTHFCVAGRTRLNEWLTNLLAFWPLGVDSNAYRIYHIVHHAYLGTATDSELMLKARFADRWVDLTPTKKLRLLARDLTGLNWREAQAIMRVFRGRYSLVRCAWLAALAAPLLALGLWPLIALWLVSLVTAHFACHRLRMWREHVGTTGTLTYVPAWWERLVYLPHYTWRHALHHQPGKWDIPAWDL